jgi:hypothetical protein
LENNIPKQQPMKGMPMKGMPTKGEPEQAMKGAAMKGMPMKGMPMKGGNSGTMGKASPQDERKIESYSHALINIVYSNETSKSVIGMLQSGDPEKSIPTAILQINSMVEGSKGSSDTSLGVKLNSNILLAKELIDVGTAGGFFELSPEQVPKVLETAIKEYIIMGVKNKSIDPIELQKEVEPLMTGEQRRVSLEAGKATGVPLEAGVEAAMETYAGQAVEKERSVVASKAEGAARKQQQAKQQQHQSAMAQAQQQGGM